MTATSHTAHRHEDAEPAELFPADGHDHGACAHDLLAHAEEHCRSHKLSLSPQRRRVLEALAASHAPLGAYELIDRLAEGGSRPAPISVYRALAFLTEAGLAHRIERLNAYVACARTHGDGGPLAFLICERCRQVGEIAGVDLGIDLAAVSARYGFVPRQAAIEITGLCARCAAG